MKRTVQFLALVAICSAMIISCKSNKQSEPTPEEIKAQKVALADSVLAQIDAFADEYMLASDNAFRIANFELTEEEKMVKPDYLLDPSFASTLVTKSQKVNALGIFALDIAVRKIYDIPLEETKEVIAKLAAEINHPMDVNVNTNLEMPLSEKIKKEYENCKARGELTYFWQFQNAILVETAYVIVQNPELFFSKISEEQWQAFNKRTNENNYAMRKLAKYDQEMSAVLELFNRYRAVSSDEEKAKIDVSVESTKQYWSANKDKFINQRNALLQ